MKNEIKIFENEEFGNVRTVVVNDVPYFAGRDIAGILGYDQPHKAIKRHCKRSTEQNIPHPQSPTKTIRMVFVPESDVYRLIINSKLPSAEKFENWVFEEVLPSIRKNGFYITDEKLEEFLENPKNVELTLRKIKKQRIKQLKNSTEYISNELRVKFNEILLNLEDVRNRNLYGGTLYKQIYKKLNSDYGIDLSERKEDNNSLLSYVKENEFECLLYSLLDCYIRNRSNLLEIQWLAEKNKMNDDFGIFAIFEEYIM